MRILFTFVGGSGHYEPLVPLARAAVAVGHGITFACRPSMAGIVLADGFAACGEGPDVEALTEVGPLVAPDLAHEERILVEGFAGRTATARARVVFDLGIELRPDLVVSDEVDFGAMLAAEQLGIPHATVSVLASGSFARPGLLVEPLGAVRARLGLPPDPGLEMLRGGLLVAPYPPSFRDPAHQLPTEALAIRPAVLDTVAPPVDGLAPWLGDIGQDRPVVYATLGTIFNMESGDLFSRLIEGLAELPVDVIATVGRQLDPTSLGPVPDHVHLERFVPQSVVLPRCDLVVSHGGSGSVIGALAFGLPSVLLPMGADQTHNAARCRELGVGRVLDPVTATASTVRDAAAAVLADPDHRSRAAAFAAESAALPDATVALARLEALGGP